MENLTFLASVWDAHEKALLLESYIHENLFTIEFDPISKWWVKVGPSSRFFDDPLKAQNEVISELPEMEPHHLDNKHFPFPHDDNIYLSDDGHVDVNSALADVSDDLTSFMEFDRRNVSQPSGASSSTDRPNPLAQMSIFPQPLRQYLEALPVHETGGWHLRLRTWYLHFSDVQYWTQFRLVDLRRSSAHWAQDILGAWPDHLRSDSTPTLHQVSPDLHDRPSAPGHAALVDLLVVQGAQHLRGGIATVYVPGTDDFYHVAIALPVHTSGLDILHKARLQFLLRDYQCTIRHGRDVIPITPTPSHQVEHGHSFTIRFQAHRATEASAESATDAPLPQLQSSVSSPSSQEAYESEIWGSDDEVMEGVRVYSLGRSACHLFVRWTTYNTVLLDVVRQLQVPLRVIVGLHYLAAPTQDQHAAEEGLILQYTGDLPVGSSGKLTLIDVELHFHEATPTVDRKVHVLPQKLKRDDLLHHLHLSDYCHEQQDRCKILWNNLEWADDDLREYDVQHGLYLRIIVPPPQDQIDAAFEEEIKELADEVQTHRTAPHKRESGSCNIDARSNVHKAMRLLQVAIKRCRSTLTPFDSKRVSNNNSGGVCYAQEVGPWFEENKPPALTMSFTEEFLRAVDAMRTAADALPEFEDDAAVPIDELDPWIQRLYEAWNRLATIGPGAMERLGRVETWFTDHLTFQRCYHTRIAVLGPDAHRWEDQLRRLWRQYIIADAVLEFHLVEPLPDDASGQTVGQLILVQRPQRFQRSIVVSIHDSEYDSGRAHSHALVMGDRVDLFSIQTMVQAHDDCPPAAQGNECTLWLGPRQLAPEERIYVRHGQALRFFIQRMRVPAPVGAVSTNLQQRIDALSDGPQLSLVQQYLLTAPFWFQALHRVFVDIAVTERQDEGPVAYINTWYLHAEFYPRCQTERTVRLRDDPMTWQRSLMEAWGDRWDSRPPTNLYWVSPAPPTTLRDGTIGHILLVQEIPQHQAAALLTARVSDAEGQALHRVAVCLPGASSAEMIVAAFPIPGPLLRYPRRVGRGQYFFDPNVPTRVQSGDGLVIDVLDNTRLPAPGPAPVLLMVLAFCRLVLLFCNIELLTILDRRAPSQ